MNTIRTLASLFTTCTALASCGGSTSPSGTDGAGVTLAGTVAGTTFHVSSVVAALTPTSSASSCTGSPGGTPNCTSSTSGQYLLIALTNREEFTCAVVAAEQGGPRREFANLAAVQFGILDPAANLAPGTYPVEVPVAVAGQVSTAAVGQASLYTSNASCNTDMNLQATGGTITLQAISATRAVGTYDVTFGSQGSFSGSFDVPFCSLPDAGAGSSTGNSICTP